VENREAILEKQRKYHEDNREAVRAYKRRHHAENRKTILEKQQQYYKANPQLTGLNYAVSASPLTEEELLNGHTRASVNASLRFDYLLRDLIIEKTGINHHVDHIAPLSRGGLHTLGNIRVIPAKANISKSNKFDHEWHNLTDEDEEAVEATTLEWLNQREAINERHSEAPS
jgi:5-methylcytosine-specific restriction endonuclease McrA